MKDGVVSIDTSGVIHSGLSTIQAFLTLSFVRSCDELSISHGKSLTGKWATWGDIQASTLQKSCTVTGDKTD